MAHQHRRRRFGRRETLRIARTVLKGEGVSAFALSVVFVGSRFIRSINREYLSHDVVTDVVSFPLGEDPGANGEIYVNLDRAATQARQYRVPVRTETRRLIIHGLLHLLGYDDATESSKRAMTRRENRYLEQLHSP